jgi:fibronectin type 3 domain-containing protein
MVCLQEGYLSAETYTDTLSLHTLTDEVYYTVVAVDFSYNHSKRSELVKLVKPDILPPFPPQIIDYTVSENKVTLGWTHSPSDDAISYEINRVLLEDSSQHITNMVLRSISKFEDTNIAPFKTYEYYLVAIDDAGLRSQKSHPLTVKTYSNNVSEQIQLAWLQEKEIIGFTWNILTSKPLFYIVYKDSGQGYIQYTNLPANAQKFAETSPMTKENKIRFALQAVYENQIKSKLFELSWKNN